MSGAYNKIKENHSLLPLDDSVPSKVGLAAMAGHGRGRGRGGKGTWGAGVGRAGGHGRVHGGKAGGNS